MSFSPPQSFKETFHGTKGILPATAAPENDVVLMSMGTFYRSLEKLSFGDNAKLALRRTAAEKILNAMAIAADELDPTAKYHLLDLEKLRPSERKMLEERYIISSRAIEKCEAKYAIANESLSFTATVNDAEHITMRSFAPGLETGQLLTGLNEFDDALAKHLPYAFDSKLGYLNSLPSRLGCGLSMEFILHLPALHQAQELHTIQKSAKAAGLELRDYMPQAHGKLPIYILGNSGSLGESCESAAQRMHSTVTRIAERERIFRAEYAKFAPNACRDLARRTYGFMKYVFMASERDAYTALADMRFAQLTGYMKNSETYSLETLFIRMREAHIINEYATWDMEEIQRHRADFLNETADSLEEPHK